MFLETKKDGEVHNKTIEPWRQLLLEAADLIEKHGHCVGRVTDASGALCVVGACMDAPSYKRDIEDLAYDNLQKFVGDTCVVNFSDTHTESEVIAAMRACANSYT